MSRPSDFAEGRAPARPAFLPVELQGFARLDGELYLCLREVDRLAPFFMNVVSNGDLWMFVGSNGALTAGRRDPDRALFPYQTADKLLRHPQASGALSVFLVEREGSLARWEPWRPEPHAGEISRHLYKHVLGASVVFEEIHHALGLRFRWRLTASEAFGLVRQCTLANLSNAPVALRYLDGWQHLLPHGVSQELYARYSYLASAYMRHELAREQGLGLYTLNSGITDRAEPCESLRVTCAWSLGHRHPTRLLCERQVDAFRRGEPVTEELEVRGEFGAYLVADAVTLPAGGAQEWIAVADIALDHAAVIALKDRLSEPEKLQPALLQSVAEDTAALRRRIAAADGLQQTADRSASTHHFANTLFNCMRGGTLSDNYRFPSLDFARFVKTRNSAIHARQREWLEGLPGHLTLAELIEQAGGRGDRQLLRLAREYLPLGFSRRHGDPSRPWNRFVIETRDAEGRPRYGYQGNWRDIFQNWEGLAQSYPACLEAMIAVFLNASTADGYNPYRLTREGLDWEVHHPADPWSHIGYWGDHQIIYLLRLLESHERFWPGKLAQDLNARLYACATVPYEIRAFDALARDPHHSITFNHELHHRLVARAAEIGGDGRLLADAAGQVALVSLAEKLLVPLLAKLSNLIPGGGIWLNTQRPEWNDANNALAGWGLSVITVAYLRRYLVFLDRVFAAAPADHVELSAPVVEFLGAVTAILRRTTEVREDAGRYRVAAELVRAGDRHRAAVYQRTAPVLQRAPMAALRELIAAALPAVEATLRANRREDGLYHSYNLLGIHAERASVGRLALMLEGQVAILSSGLLSGGEAVQLLESLRASALYREDQLSYLLYPDHPVTPFLARNTLPAGWAAKAPLLAALVAAGHRAIITLDERGAAHFQADFTSAADLNRGLDVLAADPRWQDAVARDRAGVLALWEEVFHHNAFTGRSGSMFAFEGLGSIYWHMVAKLLLAVQECHQAAVGTESAPALREAYHHVRRGLGFNKTPDVYGAFPTDPYSHTPRHRGAQQPGMTGQVKEEILTRLGELGVTVKDGCITFQPRVLHPAEFSAAPHPFAYVAVTGAERTVDLPARSLAFTFCQAPVVYVLSTESSLTLQHATGATEVLPGNTLPAAASRELFHRTGRLASITVNVKESSL